MFRTIGNAFFEARFDGNTGALMGMFPVGETTPIVAGVRVQYRTESAGVDSETVLWARLRAGRAVSVLATEHLQVKRVFQVRQGEPLMKIRYEFSAVKACRLMDPGLLYLTLADDLNDVSRDEKDLYFDGAEIGGNRELPCWRVLYRAGHRRGVMVAARSKWQMSHLMYGTSGAKGIEIRPHVRAQQELAYWKREIEIDMPAGLTRVVELEIGPWWAHRHKEIIRAARLDKPCKVAPAEPVEHVKMPTKGKVFWAADWAPESALSKVYHPRKWLVTASPRRRGKQSLVANADCRPAGFVIRPGVSGPCRVWVGGNISAVLGLKFSGDKCARYRSNESRTVFHSVMNDAGQKTELDFGVVDLTGKSIRVVPNHNGHWPVRLDYLRLEPLAAKEAVAWKARQSSPLRVPLMGIPDVGDTFFYQLDRRTLDPEVVRASVWAHAKAGFTRMYWQMHGTYTGFPTKIGTMTPLVCWAHGAFEPQAKAGGLFYRKHDLLKLVMAYGREMGVEVWGAARMNAYMSGKKDAFFAKHPQYAEITEDGTTSGNKICYAIPEVRAYHRSILVEAARYGLPGIMLGFLRHPPMLLYHPVLVSGYRARYGKLPPREPGRPDPFYHGSLTPSDEEHVRWFGYRAEFMTRFGRELKQDLRHAGLGHVKVSIWVRPNHCLFDGIDIDAWLNEGLCDEVVADIFPEDLGPLTEPVAEWKKKVQAKVPLIKGIGVAQKHTVYGAKNLGRIVNEGYDGVCSYESELFVQSPGDLALLDLIR